MLTCVPDGVVWGYRNKWRNEMFKFLTRRRRERRAARKEMYLAMASVGGEGSEFFLKLANMVKVD